MQTNRQQLATLVHNDLLQKLEEKLADLRDQYTETIAQYGPKFPKALRLDQEMQDIRSQIEAEQERVLARIRKDYTAAVTRERLASAAAVAGQKEIVGAQNQLLVQHNILAREFESNQQLYQSLLERLKNATALGGVAVHQHSSGGRRFASQRAGSPEEGPQHRLGSAGGNGAGRHDGVCPGRHGPLRQNGRGS